MSNENSPRSSRDRDRPRLAGGAARPQRADARRNYERLLRAASDAFAERGAEASLDDIARRAGVGNATLYRHFPTRHALLVAVSADEVQALCATADELRCEQPPAEALAQWLGAFVRHITSKRGLAAALMSDPDGTSEVIAASNAIVRAAAAQLLASAKEAGAVRADVDLDDLLTIARAIAAATEASDERQANRLLELALQGIHA